MTLELQDVSILRPDGQLLFAPITLRVASGQIFALMGPSGIGKSTLLDAIGGHLSRGFTLTGEIFLNGKNMRRLPGEKRAVGLMEQNARLFPHLSVGDNLSLALPSSLKNAEQRRERVERALVDADMQGFYGRDPATLSGGEQARAVLMRTMLSEPSVLMLDEPFSKLDLPVRAEIRMLAQNYIQRNKIPTLLVTHDLQDAKRLRSPIVALRGLEPVAISAPKL